MWQASRWWFRCRFRVRVPEFIRDGAGKEPVTAEEECLDALREAARRLGTSPTKAAYEELGLTPASATIIRTLGGWNDAKEAAGLSTNASTGSRVGPPPETVPEEVAARWGELSVDQRWHYRNREWNTERTLQRRAELREWVDEQTAEAACVQCGESDPRCLDLHHLDSTEKSLGISEMITRGTSKPLLSEEMEKCEVLCTNCHRAEHMDEFGRAPEIELREQPYRLVEREHDESTEPLEARQRKRAWVRSYKERRGCAECGNRTATALDFHHTDPRTKTKSVSQLITDGCTVQCLLREIKLCEIVCANCHRKLHAENGH